MTTKKLHPRKKIREVLFSIQPLRYRIVERSIDKKIMNKILFKKVIDRLRKIEERRDFLQDEIGIDMTTYEDQFFEVIENLMKMHFNKSQLALIQTYLYDLLPDKEWDGTITLSKNKKEITYNFKTSEDVWNVINLV